MLDLSDVSLRDHDIARFPTKLHALEFAQIRGWNTSDVMYAYNRFGTFWVVGNCLPDEIRLATQAPGWVALASREEKA